MSDQSNSSGSDRTRGWTLVNAQGEVEDSDGESSSSGSSIEVMQRDAAAWGTGCDRLGQTDPGAHYDSSVEGTELEQLMNTADAASIPAASSSAQKIRQPEPMTADFGTAFSADVGRHSSCTSLASLKPTELSSHSRSESTGEAGEEMRRNPAATEAQFSSTAPDSLLPEPSLLDGNHPLDSSFRRINERYLQAGKTCPPSTTPSVKTVQSFPSDAPSLKADKVDSSTMDGQSLKTDSETENFLSYTIKSLKPAVNSPTNEASSKTDPAAQGFPSDAAASLEMDGGNSLMTVTTDQGSQTDMAPAVLLTDRFDRRASSDSLWSFSLQSSTEAEDAEDGVSGVGGQRASDSESSSFGAIVGDGGSSDCSSSLDADSDTEPEFIRVAEEEPNCSLQSLVDSGSRSRPKVSDSSRSSIGSEFSFFSKSEASVSSETEPLQAPSGVQQNDSNPEGRLQQQQPRQKCEQEQQPSPPSEESCLQREGEEEKLSVAGPASLLASLFSPLADALPAVDVEEDHRSGGGSLLRGNGGEMGRHHHLPCRHRRPACRLSLSSSSEQVNETDSVSPEQMDTPSPEDDISARSGHDSGTIARWRLMGLSCYGRLKHWLGPVGGGQLGGQCGGLVMVGAVLVVVLAFVLGLWMGVVRCQSRHLESELWELEQLRVARDEHRQCELNRRHLQQQTDAALKREQQKLRALLERQAEAKQRAEQEQQSYNHKKAERRAYPNKQNGASDDDPTTGTRQQRKEESSLPFFSMQGELNIGINITDYLRYLRVNVTALRYSLKRNWDAGETWTRRAVKNGTSAMFGAVGSLGRAIRDPQSVWKGVTSSLSNTYHILSAHFNPASYSTPPEADENLGSLGKKGEKEEEEIFVDENDEEEDVYVEAEEEMEQQDYDDWDVEEEEGEMGVVKNKEKKQKRFNAGRFEEKREEWNRRKGGKHRGGKRRKRWTRMAKKLMKKTRRTFTRVGKTLQNAWHRIKDSSWRLWSGNSVLSRMGSRLANGVYRMSAKLQKKFQHHFYRHPKGEKDASRHQEKRYSEEGKEWKKKDHEQGPAEDMAERHNKTQEAARNSTDKLREREKSEPKNEHPSKASDDKKQFKKRDRDNLNRNNLNVDKTEKDKSQKADENKNSYSVNNGKERGNDETKQESQKKKNGHKKEKSISRETMERSKSLRSDQEENNAADKSNPKTKTRKPDMQVYKTGKNREKTHDGLKGKLKVKSLNAEKSSPFDEGMKRRSRKLNAQGDDDDKNKPVLSNADMTRIKFRIESRFQDLFSKVGGMEKEHFRTWSGKEILKMASDLRAMFREYKSELGLPISGSRWLECQHGFWVGAVSHHFGYEPSRECFRLLAPWQISVLEEEDEEGGGSLSGEGGMEKGSVVIEEGEGEREEEREGSKTEGMMERESSVSKEEEEWEGYLPADHDNVDDGYVFDDDDVEDFDDIDVTETYHDADDIEDDDDDTEMFDNDYDIYDEGADTFVDGDVDHFSDDEENFDDETELLEDDTGNISDTFVNDYAHGLSDDEENFVDVTDIFDDDDSETLVDEIDNTKAFVDNAESNDDIDDISEEDEDEDDYEAFLDDNENLYDDGKRSESDTDDSCDRNDDDQRSSQDLKETQGFIKSEPTATPSTHAHEEESKRAWLMHRAQGRNRLRSEEHQADWIFDRALERNEARRDSHKADWVFERAADRDSNRHKTKRR